MSGQEINVVLAFLHIISAIGWMGTTVSLMMVTGPVMGTLSPGSRSELALKLIPRIGPLVGIFSTLTIIFGIALVWTLTNGNLGALSPTTIWGIAMSSGMALTIGAVVLGTAGAARTSNKILKIIKREQSNQEPDANGEIPRLQNRLRISLALVIALQVSAVAMMVIAARLF